MTDKEITVTNYDKIKALASNQNTIQRFAELLGNKQYAQSYIASAMMAVANSNDLMECTPSSIFNTVMRAAALRLSCDPATKQAHIVPFYNKKKGIREAQFIPGYVGLNQLAQRTGKYRHINTGALYEGQELDINQLTGEPTMRGSKKNDAVVGYFHYFELFNGFKHILYMTVKELREHGEKYAPQNPKWKTDFPAMAKKTVTRLHLLHDGILDPFDRSQIEAAQEEIDGEISEPIDAVFTEADDETAEANAAAEREKREADKAAETPEQKQQREAAIMADLTGEPTPAPTNGKAQEQPKQDAPAAPAHVEYTGTLIGYGKGRKFPQAWMTKIPAFVKENNLNAYEVAEIIWKANLPQDTPVEDVIDAVWAHLEGKGK